MINGETDEDLDPTVPHGMLNKTHHRDKAAPLDVAPCATRLTGERGERDQPEQLAELFDAFKSEFAQTDEGARHFAKDISGRDAGRQNFAEVQASAARGTDVTDLVLLEPLPHMDTAHNRNRGAWCHVAPAVYRDIRTWFENVGWTKPEDWPLIARHILTFVVTVNNEPENLSEACDEIAAKTKGVQSAFLSPILNALNPAAFVIVNSKTLKTLKALWGLQFKAKITSYPRSNAAALELVEVHFDRLAEIRPGATAGDVLDAFCHWYISLREKDKENGKDHEEFAVDSVDRESPEFAREWWRRTFPDPGVQILRFVRWMPDLIVMGAPGADRPERPLRPVPLVVVAPSECPALTVPAQRNLSLNDPVLLTHDGRPLPRPTADGE